jgi:hypothetical protein
MSYLPHKEERFMFIIYPIICNAAATSLFIIMHTITNSNNNLYIKESF